MTTVHAEVFAAERDRLFGLAYRMLGSVADADDVVQDAWLRFQAKPLAEIERPAAFLTTVVSRLAIDRLRSAHHRRETYVGPWLPEPILTDTDPAHIVEIDETVTVGFLHVLERLGPVDRAVFLLHDVFDLPYSRIAEVVDRREGTCRQIAHRARERIRADRPPVEVAETDKRALLDAFLAATLDGDSRRLESLLHDDVVLTSDGGASVRAARRPVVSAARVARFVTNLASRTPEGAQLAHVEANGAPALLALTDDEPYLLLQLGAAVEGRIAAIHVVLNPEKLAAARLAWRILRTP